MSPIRRLLLILALTCMWGPSYLFIKLAVREIPPFTIVAARVGIGFLVLYLIMRATKRNLPKSLSFWLHSSMMAIFSSGLPFCLFCIAEQSIDSAVAAILNGSSPMFTAILAHFFIPTDRITPQKTIGVFLSLAGLLLFFAPAITTGLSGTAFGMIAALCATISYSISHVYAKKFTTGQAPFVAPTAQLLMTTVMMLPLSLLIDAPFTLSMPSSTAILGVCGLALFGTILAFTIYYKLIEHCGATAISMVACFFPVVGMFLGVYFLGESFSFSSLIASGFILLGMLFVNEIIIIRQLQQVSQKALPGS